MFGVPQRCSVDDWLGSARDGPDSADRTIIDVRSPAEYAEDHLPGAVNWPVLDDDERREVGTLYVQVSPLAARKRGAALVSRRIADILERHVAGRSRDWQPLVYCWRGGQRSGSLSLVLAQVGFRTLQLQGGYKAFRARVRADLDSQPASLRYRVLCGRTGSGKTRLLHALRRSGAQVLDLEGLAHHRGSVLGGVPGLPQPSQKHFDTRVWQVLQRLSPAQPVWVESESARIGSLRVPESLLSALHSHGEVVRIDTPDDTRVALLLDDYRDSTLDAEPLCRLLDSLVELRGKARVAGWQALARQGRWPELAAALMAEHYDPLYERSMRNSYASLDQAPVVCLRGGDDASLAAAAAQLVALPFPSP